MKPNWKLLLKAVLLIVAKICSTVPLVLQILFFIYLPSIHRHIRVALDEVWRYHIADSAVTVGLAYYLLMAFFIWQTRYVFYKASRYVWRDMREGVEVFFELLDRRSPDSQSELITDSRIGELS